MSPLARFLSFYGALFAAFGVASPFLPGLLQQDGLATGEIGVVLAAGTAVRLLAGPLGSWVADRTGRGSLVLAGFTAVSAVVTLGYGPAPGMALLLAISVAHASVLAPLTPVADALTLGSAEQGRFRYGWVRGAGSAAFIAFALLSGQLVDGMGLGVIVWLNAALLAGAAGFALLLPNRVTGAKEAGTRAGVWALLRVPMFARLMAVAALIGGSHALHDGFEVIRTHADQAGRVRPVGRPPHVGVGLLRRTQPWAGGGWMVGHLRQITGRAPGLQHCRLPGVWCRSAAFAVVCHQVPGGDDMASRCPIWTILLLSFLVSCATVLAASAQQAPAINVVPLTVRTPRAGFNRMVVSITVCEPGTDRCVTIDNVMVDTGSTGLRLESSAVPPSLNLPAFTGASGKPLAECLRFVHDDAWGPLHRADLRIGGLTAANLPIQVIADDDRPRPAGCPTSTASPTSNGTLGIGPHLLDCQGACTQDPSRPGVFVQEAGSWVPLRGTVPVESRLPNPVLMFPEHRNGVVFDLPAAPKGGAPEIVGTLTFGVATAANNRIPGALILRLHADGFFTTRYRGVELPKSYIDSGTETYILADDGLPRCDGMLWAFCAAPARTLEAALIGADGRTIQAPFTVGDYRGALDRHVGAWDGFAEVADGSSRAFVWGAPFFFGRRVALVFNGKTTGDTNDVSGPFYVMP